MGELLPKASTPWLVWEKTLHKDNTNYDNYIRESMHNEYDLKQKVFAYSKQTIQGLHNGIPPGEYVTYTLDQNRQLRPYHNGMIPFTSNNIKDIAAKSFETNPIAGTAADVSNLASAAGNELPFSLDNMGDISDAMYQEPLNPHNPLSAAFAAAAFEKESTRLGKFYQQHRDRQLFKAHNMERTIEQSNGLYYEPKGQNTPLQTSKTKSDAVYHSFPNFGLGSKNYAATNDFIDNLEMQEPYMKNVGKGTWSQYFGLDNTATKRAAEQDKNALNREVDQQLKEEAELQATPKRSRGQRRKDRGVDDITPINTTYITESDEDRAKRLKLEDAIKEQTDAFAAADYVQSVIEAESTAVDPTIEKPLLKTPTGTSSTAPILIPRSTPAKAPTKETSSTAPTLVPRSKPVKAPANGLAEGDEQAKVFMFLFFS
jgi:hypothetical protein